MTKPNVLIVNEQDEIIGSKERGTLTDTDIYRVAALWITNSKGEILLAKRHPTKKHHPNMWGPAVAGTVDEDETYESNIIKETAEEIGITNVSIVVGPKRFTDTDYKHFTQWFTTTVDLPITAFTRQENEVSELRWFSFGELEQALQDTPKAFLPSMPSYLDLFV